MIRRTAPLATALLAFALAGCSAEPADDAATSTETADDGAHDDGAHDDHGHDDGEHGDEVAAADLSGDLTVFAAASLSLTFAELADLFAEQYPGVSVTFSFAGSSDLVAQLDAGAPADVLATANESTMADAVEAGAVTGEPQVFAENVLTLAVPSDNPAGVTGLDESLDGADLVVCAPQVPCGAAAIELTELLDVELSPVSEENNVTDVLGKVATGQADAGLVYTTDAASAPEEVDVVPVDGAEQVVNHYPIAVTADSDQPEAAGAWLDFVLGPEAQAVLGEAGFGSP